MSSAFAPGRSSPCPSTPEAAGPRGRRSRSRGTSGGSARAARASFAVSADGTTLVHEPRPAASRLAWLDRVGRQTAAVGEPGALGLLQLAPDGRRVAVDVMQPDGRGRDLWAFDTGSGVASRLTYQSIDASAADLVAGRPEPRLREGRGRAPRRHRAPPGRDGTRRGAPARPGRPAPEALVSRRPLHRLRRLLAGPARPATALAALTRRKGPSRHLDAVEQLPRPLLARRAEARLRLGGVGRAGGLRRSAAGWRAPEGLSCGRPAAALAGRRVGALLPPARRPDDGPADRRRGRGPEGALPPGGRRSRSTSTTTLRATGSASWSG